MDWQTKPREVEVKSSSTHGKPTGETMSVAEFKAKYPDYDTHTTTICDPMIYRWYAQIGPDLFAQVSVGEYEIFPERKEQVERAYANAAATAR